jgi:hypothetical protein
MLKIYNVEFNDGGWYTIGGRPSKIVVAESKEKAIEIALEENPQYKKGWDVWATEFKINGYVIEVYDEKKYNRDKKIDKLGIK